MTAATISSRIDTPATRLATRIAFLAAGFALAVWSPLVPYAKARLGVDDGQLGVLLLCLGVGSVIAMPLTGALSSVWGARPMILLGGAGMLIALPLLATVSHPLALAAALALFGASLGTLDVSMNVHGSEVERDLGVPLMSGFHGMFSLGGILGAGGATLGLTQGWTPLSVTLAGSALCILMMLFIAPRLLPARTERSGPAFAIPHGFVVLISVLAGILFLIEGCILDWSALFLKQEKGLPVEQGGLAYMIFSVAMTIGRLTGDRTVKWLGDKMVMILGSLLGLAGFALLLAFPMAATAFAGFFLIGLGAANLVPILFSAAGKQTAMPAGLAIAALTTTGYAGQLLGPALVGFIANGTSLTVAFAILAVLLVPVLLSAKAVAR